MKRRQFLMLLGAATVSPRAGYSQAKMPVLGILLTDPDPNLFLKGFREQLAQAGHIDGQNIRLEIRSAEGKAALLPERAKELVRLKVDIIVASLTPAALAAKAATSDIPIVMAPASDPVPAGLVASLAQPGGNVTGVSAASAEIAAKIVELVREVNPSARRIAALANLDDPLATLFLGQIVESARSHGIGVEQIMTYPGAGLDKTIAALPGKQVDALIVQGSMLYKELLDLAIKHRLPSFSGSRQIAGAGGLIGYTASASDIHRAAVGYVDKILKGRKPADLPVELPTRFELSINLKTARALGLTLPPSLINRADEVIE